MWSGNGGTGEEPLPEGLFWLLLTGQVPTQEQADSLSKEWNERAAIPNHVIQVRDMLSQYIISLAALNSVALSNGSLEPSVKVFTVFEFSVCLSEMWVFI